MWHSKPKMSNLLKETVAWFLSRCRGERRWVLVMLMAEESPNTYEHICRLSLLRCVDTRGGYKPSAAITWLYCLLFLIWIGKYDYVCQIAHFLFLTNPKHFSDFSSQFLHFRHFISAVLRVFIQLMVSRLGWHSSFLLQWFLTRGSVL